MTYLNFRAERDDGSTSWKRADPGTALVERTSPVDYTVTLPGGDSHTVVYGREREAFVGWCDCRGFEYADEGSPCAHLCTLRQAEWSHNHLGADPAARDVHERPIEAGPTAALEEARARSSDDEPELATDGGVTRPAAGADGDTFGAPEGRL